VPPMCKLRAVDSCDKIVSGLARNLNLVGLKPAGRGAEGAD